MNDRIENFRRRARVADEYNEAVSAVSAVFDDALANAQPRQMDAIAENAAVAAEALKMLAARLDDVAKRAAAFCDPQ